MRVLLFGKNGQVGSHLQAVLEPFGEVIAFGRSDVDLSDSGAVAQAVRDARPHVVINAAAYTAVDRAESEPELAEAVNAEAPGAMARAAAASGALLVHYSTDYVFDGRASQPYTEEAPTNPLGAYGRTKLAGERAVTAAGGPHLVFRTAWVYSLHGHNFLKTMLRLGGERDELRIVDDQRGSPTYAGAIADATAAVLRVVDNRGGLPAEHAGVYHMTCSGEVSWCGFAREIFRRAGVSGVHVTPITTADYPTPAARPAYSVLSNAKLQRVFGIELPPWQEALTRCLAGRDLAAQR
jgi:dTDP-4-dehydrorhamnose reductase